MSGSINFFISMSVILPLLIGLVRFKKVQKNYRPFLIYIALSFASEIISYASAKLFKTNLLWLNVFDLIECLILVTQFNRWGFLTNKAFYYGFLFILLISWTADNLLFGDLYQRNRIFLIGYSFILILLSIRQINLAVVLSNESLFKNAKFIICIGMILSFTFSMIAHTFRFFGSGFSKDFMANVFSIVSYTNAIANIVYAFGVYYIPKKINTGAFFTGQV